MCNAHGTVLNKIQSHAHVNTIESSHYKRHNYQSNIMPFTLMLYSCISWNLLFHFLKEDRYEIILYQNAIDPHVFPPLNELLVGNEVSVQSKILKNYI